MFFVDVVVIIHDVSCMEEEGGGSRFAFDRGSYKRGSRTGVGEQNGLMRWGEEAG